MVYASKAAYDFAFYISRFDHSLGVALLTWKLTKDKKATIAALFHDASTPVFSHVIDYLHGDYVNQEYTENKLREKLLNEPLLEQYLKMDELALDDICNFKNYSVVDLDRPLMCADRLDNIISVGMTWVKQVSLSDAIRIIEDIYIQKNEFASTEIVFKTEEIAQYVKYINDIINEYPHSNIDTYMMLYLSDIVKLVLKRGYIDYEALYVLGEHDFMVIIENNSHDELLRKRWENFKNIKEFPLIEQPPIKNKIVNPLVNSKRLIK